MDELMKSRRLHCTGDLLSSNSMNLGVMRATQRRIGGDCEPFTLSLSKTNGVEALSTNGLNEQQCPYNYGHQLVISFSIDGKG